MSTKEQFKKWFKTSYKGSLLALHNDDIDQIYFFFSSHNERVVEEIKKIIGEHNARILNEFQKQGTESMPFIAYDERVCLIPAMTIATDETYSLIQPKKDEK